MGSCRMFRIRFCRRFSHLCKSNWGLSKLVKAYLASKHTDCIVFFNILMCMFDHLIESNKNNHLILMCTSLKDNDDYLLYRKDIKTFQV